MCQMGKMKHGSHGLASVSVAIYGFGEQSIYAIIFVYLTGRDAGAAPVLWCCSGGGAA